MNTQQHQHQHQHQQLMRFMEGLGFPQKSLCWFSMAQFVKNRLLAPMKPSSNNNGNKIIRLREEFLKRCSIKFGLTLSPQFILRGRSNPINPQDIIRFQSSELLQDQFLALSDYGTAILLGNTSAIAEISYRLSKTQMYDPHGNIDNHLKNRLLQFQLLLLIEYGISRRCPDCLGMMSHFFDIGFEIVPIDRQRSLELAGESAEAGSIYGWFVLARLLKDNSDRASYHDRYDGGINIYEDELGVRMIVHKRATLDEQIRRTLQEHGCESCLPQFYDGKDECHYCGFEFDVFNHYSDDDDISVSKPEQMQIAVEIYYKILSENPPSHPICVDVRKNLVKIYKDGEQLFGESVEATYEEILRLEVI